MASPRVQRVAALAILAAAAVTAVTLAWDWAEAYADGQRAIADKRVEVNGLRDLAAARASLQKLTKGSGATPLLLAADANAQDMLTAAVNHAADGQQVVIDGVEPLPPDATAASAAVHLRATQSGLYAFLHAIEGQTPYLLVPRLAVQVFRAADVEHGKPLVLSADLRLSALIAPAVATRPASTASP